MKDALIAGVLLLGSELFLLHRNLAYLSVWLLMITIILSYGMRIKYTAAVLLAIGAVFAVILISGQTLRERFEDKNEEEKQDDEEKASKNTDEPEPHMDIGSTLINAYNKLDKGQIANMQSDTKELMDTQQQLIQTLSSLGPQVQQGAELIKSFQGMFGGNLTDVLKQ
jgi:membrane protein implicated in regulation of membrane protease activity